MRQVPYGNKGTNNPMPEAYLLNNSNDDLIITTTGKDGYRYEIARGKWISTYRFQLNGGSFICKNKKNNRTIKNTMADLHRDKMIVLDGDEDQCALFADIYMWSPSAAAKLVLGLQTANGFDHWQNEQGISLGHLAWPENPKYKRTPKAINIMDWS